MQSDKREMLEQYCKTRDPALRNQLAEEYLYLAHAVARRFARRGAEVDDLVQVASVALLNALERFDNDRGLRFTTYAMPTLAGEVRNYLRDKARPVRLPRRGSELLPRILREREAVYQTLGREPSVAELAERLSIRPDDVLDVLEMQRASQTVSMNATLEDDTTFEELFGQEEPAYEQLEQSDLLERLLARLNGTSRFVIEQRYFRQRSQRDVAKELGVSQMQVSRLEQRALEMLRSKLA